MKKRFFERPAYAVHGSNDAANNGNIADTPNAVFVVKR